jgi:RNA polymerase sigma-70 factor (ECF subfamily)
MAPWCQAVYVRNPQLSTNCTANRVAFGGTSHRSTTPFSKALKAGSSVTGRDFSHYAACVKAALHRARARLQGLAGADESQQQPALTAEEQARLRSYADRFNARDFDTLRDLLAEDVQLDLVNRLRLTGRKDVSVYFGRYSGSADWKLTPALAEGQPALLVSNPGDEAGAVEYVVLLRWVNGRIQGIRDLRYAKYVTDGLVITRLHSDRR